MTDATASFVTRTRCRFTDITELTLRALSPPSLQDGQLPRTASAADRFVFKHKR
jgi:hypothetical protein